MLLALSRPLSLGPLLWPLLRLVLADFHHAGHYCDTLNANELQPETATELQSVCNLWKAVSEARNKAS